MTTRKSIFSLLIIWLFFLTSLWILQKMSLPFGFKVLPRGEDWNWLGFIEEARNNNYLTLVSHKFWSIDGRNPLSPWYWIAISPLITESQYYLYFIRCLLDPLLAITIYLLLTQLNRQQNNLFAFSVALVTLMWNFFILFVQLIWVFHCALLFSLCALFFYCRYIDEGRANSGADLALSLLCYLAAIATYTLQSGSLIGIAIISFFRKPYSSKHVLLAIKDTSFFLIILLIYYLIWNTTSPWVGAVVKGRNLIFHWKQFIKSVYLFLFHHDYLFFFNLIKADWRFTLPTFTILTVCFSKLLFTLTRSHFLNDQTELKFKWIIVLLISIATPTLILESTSHLFVPGTRSPMISQVWQPLLYVTFIFLFAHFIPLQKKIKTKIVIVLIASLAAVTTTISIEYNHKLVEKSMIMLKLKKP